MAYAELAGELGVESGLLNACSSCVAATLVAFAGFVDGGLELLEEAIDVLEVVLGTRVGEREGVALSGNTALPTASASHVASVVKGFEQRGGSEVASSVSAVVVSSVVSGTRLDW